MHEKCTIVRFPVEDLDKMASDPGFNTLVRDGWTIVSNLVVENAQRQPVLVITLAPPGVRQTPLWAKAAIIAVVVLEIVQAGCALIPLLP